MRWRPMPWLPESPLALAALPLIALAALLVAHALSRTGTRGRARLVTASVFAALFASGVAVQWQLNARLQSDAFYYFAYLRSIAFDRDVDFTNDYPLLGLSDKAYLWQPPTPTGYAHSAWTIGPAIVWAPFFGGAHLAALRQQGQGVQVATDGTSYPVSPGGVHRRPVLRAARRVVLDPGGAAVLSGVDRGDRRRRWSSAGRSSSGTRSPSRR